MKKNSIHNIQPNKKKILIILANTKTKSFCKTLANTYQQQAKKAKHQIKTINLANLKFDPILHQGNDTLQPPEPDLIKTQKLIKWANHIVLIYPTWWMTYPAILKGFLDRTLTSGFAYKYHKGKMLPEQLLKGKSARLITTMDTPPWIYHLWFGSPGHKAIKKGTLGFCGISPIKISNIGSLKLSNETKRKQWLNKIKQLGKKGI